MAEKKKKETKRKEESKRIMKPGKCLDCGGIGSFDDGEVECLTCKGTGEIK